MLKKLNLIDVNVVLPKLYCMATETFWIHVQPNYDIFMVKLSGNFIYIYGKRYGPLAVSHTCITLYKCNIRCRQCKLPAVNENFSNVYMYFSFYKSDSNETFNQLLTDLYSVNCLIIYRACIVHQNEAIYGLLKESKTFIKFNIFGLYHLYETVLEI